MGRQELDGAGAEIDDCERCRALVVDSAGLSARTRTTTLADEILGRFVTRSQEAAPA